MEIISRPYLSLSDPIQAEILFYLTGENPDERNWMKLKPRDGSLFVVGDPKQAIYRFRRADISAYKNVKNLMLQNGGAALALTENFRSEGALCRAYNDAFSKEQFFAKEDNDIYQAKYLHMTSKQINEDVNRVFKYTVANGNKEDVKCDDVEKVVDIVQKLIKSKKVQPKDIMIITPLAMGNAVYFDALIKEGIPVSHTGEISLNNNINNRVINVLKVIQNPDDSINLVAVLTNIFNIDPIELKKYKENGGKLSIFADDEDKSGNEDSGEYIRKALNRLKGYYFLKSKINNPVALTDYIVEDLAIQSGAMNLSDSGQSFTKLNQLLDAQKDISGVELDNDLSKHIKRMETVCEKAYKNQIPSSLEENEVRIMNLHQAKGLEAKVVILASPYKSQKDRPVLKHIERSQENEDKQTNSLAPEGYFNIVRNTRRGAEVLIPVSDWDVEFEEEKKYLKAEENRLLYVAATRAMELLIIADYDKENEKGYWYSLIKNINCPELDDSCLNALKVPDEEKPHTKNYSENAGDSANSSEQDSDLLSNSYFYEFENSWRKKIIIPSYISILPSKLEKERVKEVDELGITFKQEDELFADELVIIEPSMPLSSEDVDEQDNADGQPYGPVWGTCIHRIFEQIINGFIQNKKAFPNPDETKKIIKKAITEILLTEDTTGKSFKLFYSDSLEDPQDIKKSTEAVFTKIVKSISEQVDKFYGSDIAKAIQKADRIMPEMAFWLKVDKVDTEKGESQGDGLYDHLAQYSKSMGESTAKTGRIIVSGVIDLVVKVDDKWSIVDYKTNKPHKGKTMAEMLKSKYSSQLKAYKMIFERLTEKTFEDICLYSTVTGELIKI